MCSDKRPGGELRRKGKFLGFKSLGWDAWGGVGKWVVEDEG